MIENQDIRPAQVIGPLGEPFFGEDRFDLLVWRLKENGLTRRFAAVTAE